MIEHGPRRTAIIFDVHRIINMSKLCMCVSITFSLSGNSYTFEVRVTSDTSIDFLGPEECQESIYY